MSTKPAAPANHRPKPDYDADWQKKYSNIVMTAEAAVQALTDVVGADPDLSRPSTELLGGLKWSARAERWSFETAFIENLFSPNNGVDIGLRAGVAFRIAPR